MNRNRIRQYATEQTLQSMALVVLNASLLGLMGWIVGGPRVAAVSIIGFSAAFFLTPKLNPERWMRLYRGQRLTDFQAPVLLSMTRDLAARAGLPAIPAIYLIPSQEMGAFAMGTADNAVIGLTHGLVKTLKDTELQGVIAHEITHIRNRDIRLMNASRLVGQFTGILSMIGIVGLILSLPLILLGVAPVSLTGLLILISAPQLSLLIERALSRVREFQADLGAAELTGNPSGLARALQKIEQASDRQWLDWLVPGSLPQRQEGLQTHPPTRERIRRLLSMASAETRRHRYARDAVSISGRTFTHPYPPEQMRIIIRRSPDFTYI
ncbi:MAG: hypothetical protein CSA22_05740 [Deltaproteobacteria bacterium]|nr:MAG: hypothetical protein CSA22_05740 [Deltaproteobacteria bacterium]